MKSRPPIVGILDLQGDVIEHRRALVQCGATVVSVKTANDLAKVQALVLPGGESTAIGKLLHWN
ncbi:MAG: pyridoxal 5'-phosphate synthase glutaminase subunit PdxT, partial [Candidatus Gracilibacteria bacterium]